VIPRTISATSLDVAALCLARWKAEFLDRGRGIGNDAANVGLVCHNALEEFVRGVFMREDMEWDWATLEKLFNESFDKIFGADRTVPQYQDAHDILFNWFMRDDQYEYLSSVRILSLESKNSFTVPGKDPATDKKIKVPFNYVMDRVDRISDTEIKVVDYKSNRHPLTEDQLRKKKQARYYALAIQIVWPKTERIVVEFDFLRHRPVNTVFTRDDNIVTWRELVRSLQRILDTPDSRIPETLNAMCGYCVRKSTCKTLESNIAAGGIFSRDLKDLVSLYENITNQQKAQDLLVKEIELLLLNHAIEEDVTEYEVAGAKVEVTLPVRRSINNELASAVLGTSAAQYANYTVTQVLKLVSRNSPLPVPQRELLKEAIEYKESDPKVKVTPASGFDD
jgi:hypothetical protein